LKDALAFYSSGLLSDQEQWEAAAFTGYFILVHFWSLSTVMIKFLFLWPKVMAIDQMHRKGQKSKHDS